MIGGAGQLLERSIVDRMVGFGERLCFEGAPLLIPPLVQNSSKRALMRERTKSRLGSVKLKPRKRKVFSTRSPDKAVMKGP
jgi:hypothetical protein